MELRDDSTMIENGSQSRASVWDQFRVPLGQLAALPRRAYKTLSGLLDTRAFVRGRPGTCARHGDPIWLDEVSWYRSRVVLTGWAEESTIICRFGAQEHHSFDLHMGIPTAANHVRRFEVEIPRLVQNSPLEVWSGNTPNALPITLQPPLRYLEFLVRLSRLPEAICLILSRRKDIFQLIPRDAEIQL